MRRAGRWFWLVVDTLNGPPVTIGFWALMAAWTARRLTPEMHGWRSWLDAFVFVALVAGMVSRFRSYLWELPAYKAGGGGGGKEKVCGQATSTSAGSRSHQEAVN